MRSRGLCLEVEGLSTELGVTEVTFSVHAGEVLGLGGMVGSGRTDIARALFGVDRPTAGVIRLNGRAVRFTSPEQAIANGVALVPENRKADGLFMNFRGPGKHHRRQPGGLALRAVPRPAA